MRILIFAAVVLVARVDASDLVVRDVRVKTEKGRSTVTATVRWANAWRTARNHDAVWLTLRHVGQPRRGPIKLAASGHVAEGKLEGRLSVSEDGIGVFLVPGERHRGDVEWQLSLAVAEDLTRDARVEAWAMEMVYVPAGAFELGDDHRDAVRHGALFRSGEDRGPAGPYRVASEAAIDIGRAPGELFYEVGRNGPYRGDQKGPIPAGFPKGVAAFFVMKYEVRQGEYARFLNALPPEWQTRRAIHEAAAEKKDATCSVAVVDGKYVAKAADRPCNYLSWTDSCAFAAWLGLRPMTELEFEKACRGPARTVPLDYPWGTADAAPLARTVERSRDLRASSAKAEAGLDDDTRVRHGASHYWVMDLSGSLWERVVSIGHPKGRAFRGTNGTGVLGEQGTATNPDWPRAGSDDANAPGVGYRGGAEYFAKPSITNPASPVALRTYGAWDGAYRYKTYSARACRGAPRAERLK